MKRAWERLRNALEGNMRQQITRLGFFFTVMVAVVGLAAFVSGNNLLFLLLAALLSTMLISGFVSRLGLAGLELNLVLPDHITARRPVQGRLLLRNRKLLSPSFSLHLTGAPGSGLRQSVYFPIVPARTLLQEPVELQFDRRGIHKENTFSFESRFPFGFTHRRAQVDLQREVLVYPSIEPHPVLETTLAGIAGEIESRQQGRGTDFYRIRPYEHLESARHVDWRATAHTGELQIREFTREQERTVTLFLDLNAPFGARFELSVDCCAFLVWRLHDRGTRVRLLTQRYDRRLPEEATVYDILKYLALVDPIPGAALALPDAHSLPVAITIRENEAAEAGWLSVRLPSPDHAGDAVGANRAGSDIDHRS